MEKMKLNIQLFGATCTIGTISESTSIDSNTSTFTIPATLKTDKYSYNYSNAYMTLQWKYASASSWTNLSKQSFSINKSSSVSKNWTLTLEHNSDGSLENIQFRVRWYVSDSTNGTTGATTYTPTTIPRASQPRLSSASVNMNSAVTIYTDRVSTSFTHTIRYWFGNANGTIATNVTDNVSWTPPVTLANQIPSATSGIGTIYCDTYSNGNLIGTKEVGITLNVPSNIIPSVSFTNVSEAGVVPSSWGIYVKNKSRIALAISGSGIYGSTISSYRISYYGGAITTSSGTTSYLTQAGLTTFTAQVTDTRGRSASTTWTINVVDYYNPTISTAQVQRCDVDGNIDNNGEYMYISYTASISPASNKNTPSSVYKVGYRVQNTGDYQYVPLTTNANSYSVSGMLFTDGIKQPSASGTKVQFSTSNTYDVQFYVKDYFMEYTNVQTLDTGFDLMNFNPSGKAMAIGKVSEAGANEELLEIGMDTEIFGILNAHRIELFTDGISRTPYIDFHHNGSSADYTSRIIEKNAGELSFENDVIFESNIKKHITINNESGRVGSNIVLRGTTASPEASINVGNISNGTKSYIFGYNVGGTDRFGIYSNEGNQNISYIDKNGNMWVRGYISSNNGVRVYQSMTFADYVCTLSNTDLGVDDCTKYMWSFQPNNWENYFFVNSATTTSIMIRGWRISGTSSATITLINNASYGAIVLGVRIG